MDRLDPTGGHLVGNLSAKKGGRQRKLWVSGLDDLNEYT